MKKIKYFIESEQGKDILIITILILVGIGSFLLGRLSKESPQNGLNIKYNDKSIANEQISQNKGQIDPKAINTNLDVKSTIGSYFASNRGKKYYPIDCNAGNSIKESNKIYFSSAEEAEQAGYSLSSACN